MKTLSELKIDRNIFNVMYNIGEIATVNLIFNGEMFKRPSV